MKLWLRTADLPQILAALPLRRALNPAALRGRKARQVIHAQIRARIKKAVRAKVLQLVLRVVPIKKRLLHQA